MKYKKGLKLIILSIYILNILIIAIPINSEEFIQSNHLFLSLLRSFGFEPQETITYQQVPSLMSESLSRTSQGEFLGGINYKKSIYFIPGWADTRWQFRKNITISSTQVSANLFDFPVLIDLYDSDLQKDAQASGNDIMFTDASGNILNHEIESFQRIYNSTHAHLVTWVKTNLSSSQDTIVSMYYGNPVADNQENPIFVWDENYVGVWHLNEKSGSAQDSTSYGTNGVVSGDITQFASGQVGESYDFDGSTGKVDMGDPADNHLDFGTGSFTVEAWIYRNSSMTSDQYGGIFKGNGDVDIQSGWLFRFRGSDVIRFSGGDGSASVFNIYKSGTIIDDTWMHVIGVLDRSASAAYIYKDGQLLATDSSITTNSIDTTRSLKLFEDWSTSYHFKGILDEIRLSNIARSTDWIATEYNNQYDPNSFYTISTPEENPREIIGPSEVPWYNPDWLYRNKISINQSKVGINPFFSEITITTSSSALPSNYSISVTFDHADLVKSGKSRMDGNDIRIMYDNNIELIELDRMLDPSSSWNNNETTIWFQTQAVIPAFSSNNDYYLYYGNMLAGSPPSNSSNVFFHYDGFESGNLSGWDGSSEGSVGDSISASTDQAYTGSYSAKCIMDTVSSPQAMVFEEFSDEMNLFAKVPLYLDPSLYITDRLTVMQYVDSSSGWQNLVSVTIDQDMTLYIWNAIAGQAYGYQQGNTISTGVWHTLELQTKISDTAGEVRLWLDDSLEIEATGINISTQGIDMFCAGIYWAGNNEPNTLYIDDIYLRLGVDTEPTVEIGTETIQNLTNFPVLINSTLALWKDSNNEGFVGQSDGGDFLFTSSDGITKLNYELEKYNPATGDLVAWVNVPSVSFGLDTDIYIYYGNSIANDQWNVTGTWNSDYVGVWHLKEDASGTGTSGLYKDSTLNGNDGDDYVSDIEKAGKIDGGQGFDGNDDYIDMGNASSLDIVTGNFTLEAWVRLDAKGGDRDVISKACDGVTVRAFELRYDVGEDFWMFNAYDTTWQYAKYTQSNPELGKWYHLVAVRDGSTIKIYVDGVEGAVTDTLGTMDDSSAFSLLIGRLIDPSDPRYFNGNIDEVRVSKTVLSLDWIVTEYNNQKDVDSFYSIDNCEYYYWWADTSFSKRKDIIIDHTQFGSTIENELIDYPFLIDLYDSDLKTDVQSDGDDILFVDTEGRKIDHEIELFDQNGNGTHAHLVVWIRIPILNLKSDTKISMYYGNSIVESQENPSGVWTEDFKGVWHLSEDPSGSAPQIEDSTENNNHGTTSNLDTDDQITGQIDGSIDFDNNQDHVDCGNDSSLNMGTGDLSLSLWFNYDAGSMGPLAGKGAILGGIRYYIAISVPAGIVMGQIDDNTVAKSISSVSAYGDNTWHYVVMVKDGNYLRLYIDGVEGANSPIDITGYGTLDNVHSFYINTIPSDNSGTLTTWSTAKLDEVRVSAIARSSDWIKTEFNNQYDPSNLYKVGSEYEIDITPPVVNNFGVDDLGTGIGTFWADITDIHSNVNSALIKINGTEYSLSFNGTYWIKQLSVEFSKYYVYQIVNSSDTFGNFLDSPSSEKSHTFNLDNINPSVDDWEYYDAIGPYGTFKANVSDSWGTINTVLVNITEGTVPAGERWASMVLTASGFMNDTIILSPGTIKFVIIVNDTAGNTFTSSEHQGLVPGTNQPPSAENITLSRSDISVLLPIYSNNILYLNYTYSDPENDDEGASEIRWYKNGIYQPTYDDQSEIPAIALVKGDKWNVTIRPNDGQDFGDLVASPIVEIQNTPPAATSVVILPGSPVTTSTLSVSYSYSDYDGDSQNTANREIYWYKGGVLQSSLNNNLSIASGFTSKGEEWYYEIRVHDGTNYSSWVTSTSVTIANSAPSATTVQVLPSAPVTGDTLTATYTFSDADGDGESGSLILWYKNGVLQKTLNDSLTVDSSLTLKGENWYFTIQPRDGTTYGTLKQAPTVVIGNTAPSAASLQIIPGTPSTGDILNANYTFIDADNDAESGTLIIWYKDGLLQGSLNNSPSVASSYTAKGQKWHFKIKPSDGIDTGIWYNCPLNVTIENTAPLVSNLAINPSSPDTLDNLFVTYDYFDADLDPEAEKEILWYINGSLQSQFTNLTLLQSGNTTKGQIWHVKVRVFDGVAYSLWSALLINVTINNAAPSVTDVTINGNDAPTQVGDNEDLIGNYVFSDPDGDSQVNASREIFWYKKSQLESSFILQGYLNNSLIVGNESTTFGDTWYFIIRVYDGVDYSTFTSSPSVSIGVPPNTPPEVQFLNITPAIPVTLDSLYINYTFVDADNDNDSGSLFYWYRNGVLMPQYNGLRTLPAFATSKGEVWHVKVRPRDGIDFGQLVSVPVNVTIGNIAPEANTLYITPSSAQTANDLSVDYIFVDIDGDSESGTKIIWFVDGVLQNALNNSFIIKAGNTTKGQEWHFKICPSDGTDFGIWIGCSENITIENTAPSVSLLTISPLNPKTDESLSVNYLFSDSDAIVGDVEISSLIQWFKNGEMQTSYENQTTIPSLATKKGENWWFEVTPFDGTDYGSKKTSPLITIKNTAPSISNLQFNPSQPTTGIDLVISYNYFDLDNQDNPNIDIESGTMIRWYRNGLLEATYSDMIIVDGAVLVKGDLWNVSIQVSDGSDFSTWLNGSVIIVNTSPEVIADTAEIFEPPISGIVTTSSLIASWDVYDADGDTITDYKIIWENRTSGSGSFIEQPALENLTEVPATFTKKNQDWRFKIQIFDGEDWSIVSSSFVSTIRNSEPVIGNILLSGGQTTTDSISVTYDYYDADGDSDQSEITWVIFHISPPFLFQPGTNTLSDSEFVAGDLVWVEITPDDGDSSTGQGDTIDTSRQSGVGKQIQVGNTAPQINTTLGFPVILADHPDGTILYTAGYFLFCNYSTLVYDIDHGESPSIFDTTLINNENLVYYSVDVIQGAQYRWYRFNTILTKWELQPELTKSFVDSYYLKRDDQWMVSICPRDNYGYYGSWVNSTEIIIGNSYPQVLGFQWSNMHPTTTNDLFFAFDYFDYDDDLIVVNETLILWYKNGLLIPGTENHSSLSNQYFVKGDQIHVIIRPSDGTNWAGRNYTSTEFVGILLIVNSYPIASNITITPSTAYTTNDLVLSWTFNDADGDSENSNYIIKWRRSGVLIPEFENMTTIPFINTSKGETWQAQIWVFDGTNYSSIGYYSNNGTVIVIQNTPPEITDLFFIGIINQTTTANADLLINWYTDDLDNDGQVDYRISWYQDNGSGIYSYRGDYGDHSILITSTDLKKGHSWYCIIEIYDGTDWSSNATSPTILIINAVPEVTGLAFIFDPLTSQVDPDIRTNQFYVEDENISISFNYYDIDNDSTKTLIQWFKIVNGSINEIYSYENASVIPASGLSPGDQWFCQVTAFDGFSSGTKLNSSVIFIYSRPICHSYLINPDKYTEGKFTISVTVDDYSFNISEVELITVFYDNTSKSWPASNSGGNNWTVQFEHTDPSYLDTNITITVKSSTKILETFEIYSLYTFIMRLEDKVAPRVRDAYFDFNDEKNPTNITFKAVLIESWTGISLVELYYYFSPVNDTEGKGASIQYNYVIMNFKEYNPTENYFIYEITVDFIHNNSDTDILYWISTTDGAGNNDPLAFDIRNDSQRLKEQRFIYTPPGIPEWMLLVAGLIIVVIFIGAIVYIKFIRKPELVGLDKELVLSKITEISDQDVLESLDQHTIGITISFFDQRHGPIPIVIVPGILKDNFSKLVELSDRSFSGTGFSDNFENEIPSSYDFVLDYGVRASVLSFGFALNRPTARGGQENLTLNILIYQDMFPLVQSFQMAIQSKVHEIHMIMDDENIEKDVITHRVTLLRQYVSLIILSYLKIYGTTDLLEEE